jgi:hypothetical protein
VPGGRQHTEPVPEHGDVGSDRQKPTVTKSATSAAPD